ARSRHHIGRGGRGDPRRALLRAAADGAPRGRRHRARQLRAVLRRGRRRGAAARDRTHKEDFRMNEEGKTFRVEEVDGVETPPRARVEDAGAESAPAKLERKKDYLEGFLAQKPQAVSTGAP